ncbi:Protein of unknown function [Aliiroseovarius halocynthiae]|uniref:DUF2484 family protein n=1 Tax=Aliiroseovarius halocynthiae TaxID=985055 RepID=A0A545SVH7_9RHOB|nr:DUF2484 family protein [Aliiroseovarius halocynthiae]TQV68968.1 DUF2484 family protein [Aliiroseovarius halocynthiae]SMR71710.1 Protein of unknown function [Aliiroseovarius halocynthiae]
MSLALVCAALWVIAASFVAMLPMRMQFPPGLALLILAPALIIWIGMNHGWLWVLVGTFGFVSMFRRPLWYFVRKWTGRI